MSTQDTRSNGQALAGLFDYEMLMSDEFSRDSGLLKKAKKGESDKAAEAIGLLQMPKTWEEKAHEDGKMKYFGKQLLNDLTGGFLEGSIFPESIGGDARYASDLKLYQKSKEMALVDPQDQAVAEAIRAGITGPELMALQAEAGGLDKLNLDSFTLSPGQIRSDSFGNEITRGGPAVSAPGSIERRADAFANGYGISRGTRAYADIVAAMSEPTHTETLPDGRERTYNTIDAVRNKIENGFYGQGGNPTQAQAGGAAPGQGGQAGPQGQRVPGISAEDLEISNLQKQAMEWDNERQGEFKEKNEFYGRLQEQMDKLGTYDEKTGTFRARDAVRDIYGSVDSKFPVWARGDDERMAQALIDQVVEILAVDERGKLKGQGQITEGETKMLRESLTVLTNMGIGDSDMEEEVARLYKNVLGLSDAATNFRSSNPYRKQLEARADGMPTGFEED